MSPSPRRGMNAASDGSSRAATAAARLRAWRSASTSRSSSEEVSRISRCWAVAACSSRDVDVGQRVGHRLLGGAREQRGDLDQLQVAHRPVGHVEVGVEAQLAQARADARDAGQQLVAQRLERGVQRLVGAEELLGDVLPLGAGRGARVLGELRRRLARARRRGRRVGEHEPACARGSSRRGAGGASRRRARRGCRARPPLPAARRGSARSAGGARPASAWTCRPRTKTWSNSVPLEACIEVTATKSVRPGASSLPASSSCRPASATAET